MTCMHQLIECRGVRQDSINHKRELLMKIGKVEINKYQVGIQVEEQVVHKIRVDINRQCRIVNQIILEGNRI